MVNKIRRFFRALGGKGSSSGSSSTSTSLSSWDADVAVLGSDGSFVSGPYGSSSAVNFRPRMAPARSRRYLPGDPLSFDAAPPGTSASTGIPWAAVLSKIPKLVAEATPPAGEVDMRALEQLRDLLSQLAHSSEYRRDMRTFYYGGNGDSSDSRRVLRRCRRSLALCWRALLAQLLDERAARRLAGDERELFFDVIGFIAERVEFNLHTSCDSFSIPTSTAKPPADMDAWLLDSPAGFLSPNALSSRGGGKPEQYSFMATPTASSSLQAADAAGAEDTSDSDDGVRELYLYRCLLLATSKLVVESLDAARHRRRAWVSLAESRFFAKVLAVCFVRVPVMQHMILDDVFAAYRRKHWSHRGAHDSKVEADPDPSIGQASAAQEDPRRRRASASVRLWNGASFAGSLRRWSEYRGNALNEDDSAYGAPKLRPVGESSSHDSKQYESFRQRNPTLFGWTQFSPYLAPYADTDVFALHRSLRASWSRKLTHDGEFFATFMGFVSCHVEATAVSGDAVQWDALPGYALLARVSLLLVKEACWAKWLYVRDTSGPLPSSSIELPSPTSGSESDDEGEPFALPGIRAIRTTLDNVSQLLRNREMLDACVMAMYESTNVLHARSVDVCLVRFEEWLSAAAEPVTGITPPTVSAVPSPLLRAPLTFNGQAFGVGLRVMLATDNCEILNRTIQFLYHRVDFLDGDLRHAILKAVVQRHMALFLHWNADVRANYHHLLVYRIMRVARDQLESPIDRLLLGRMAMSSAELSARDTDGFDLIDDSQHHHDSSDLVSAVSAVNRPPLTTSEFNRLRMEQALWRAFDACIAVICVAERKNAREAHRRYQTEIFSARCRAIAFRNLHQETTERDANGAPVASTSSVNEALPGGRPALEVEHLDEELRREPPYYLRYLPAEDVALLDELRRLASAVRYPAELQIYAAPSLRGYSDLLKKYYHELQTTGVVDPPALGFC